MKKFNQMRFVVLLLIVLIGATYVYAATSPSLGASATYGVLSSTYTNTVPGTTINGDVGFTTGPAVVPGGTHTNYGSGAPYSTAGTDQASALSALNSQVCTFTFAPGAIDLATDTTHGTIGVYTPGVYCISGAASVGTAGINLSGSGTYIFRMTGALDTVANSVVSGNACDIFWTPGAATTLGANSTFKGTDISAAGITMGVNVNWNGRALAFGGTVTTSVDDNITAPSCGTPPPPPPLPPPPSTTGSITVNKTTSGGDATFSFTTTGSGYSNFNIATVGGSGSNTQSGLVAGTYSVTETVPSEWIQNSTTCSSITVVAGQTSVCAILNTKSIPLATSAKLTLVKTVINDNGGIKVVSNFPLFVGGTSVTSGTANTLAPGTYAVSETNSAGYVASSWGGDCSASGSITLLNGDNKTCTITNNDVAVVVPLLPQTGLGPDENSTPWNIIALVGVTGILVSVFMIRRKQII